MDKKIYNEVKKEIIELKKQLEYFEKDKLREYMLYNELSEVNDFLEKKDWILVFKILVAILTTTLAGLISWSFISPPDTFFKTILFHFPLVWILAADVFCFGNAKKITKELKKNKDFNILNKKELNERREEIVKIYKKTKEENQNKKQELNRYEQLIHQKIIDLPLETENVEEIKPIDNMVEEFINEPIDYKDIDLKANLKEVEIPKYNKKLTKVYKNHNFML